MLLEELVEQHRVHLIVADGFRFAISIGGYKVWIDIGNFLGDQSKRERTRAIDFFLVAEGNRFKRKKRFARLAHRLNLLLVAARGHKGSQFAVYIDVHCSVTRDRSVNVADPSGVVGASNTLDALADAHIAIARGEIKSGANAQGGIVAAGIAIEGVKTTGGVAAAGGVALEGGNTVGRIGVTGGVSTERTTAVGRVGATDSVLIERARTVGRVFAAGGVAQQRLKPVGRV